MYVTFDRFASKIYNIRMIYTRHQIASSSLIDAKAQLSYMGLFDVVEDAITEGMGKLHLDGVTVKRDYGAFWVFTKNKIKLLGTLAWGEEFVVESFVSALSSAKMVVDTAVKRLDGTFVAYSVCEMCVLDLVTGCIRRTSTVGIDENFVVETPQMQVSFDKIEDADLPQVEKVMVRSTNVDYSQHCNNVEYMRFIFNTYSVAELKQLYLSEIEVCYVAQSYEGDELTVHKATAPDSDLLAVKKNGSTVIKCRIRK